MRSPHAFLYRAVRGGLLAAALVGSVQVAHAYYANGTPPAGFSGSPGAWTFAPKTSAEAWLAKTASTTTTLNVGGKTVTMNALLRLSSQAPRAAAKAMFGGPLMMTATALALLGPLAIEYMNGQWTEPDTQQPVSDGLLWRVNYNSTVGPWASSKSAACLAFYNSAPMIENHGYTWLLNDPNRCGFAINPNGTNTRYYPYVSKADTSCPAGWYETQAGCVQTAPPKVLTEEEFTEKLLPYITPEQVPDLVPPGTPLPVDLPIINPTPGSDPKPQIKRLPLGDFSPYPAPNSTTSTQYRAPILDLIPSPTQSEPWRVDAQPKDIVKEVPNDQPAPDPLTDPVDVPKDTPDPQTPTESKTPGLCEMYPDILACAKPELDKPEEAIPKKTENIEFTEMNLWGGGSCPANVSVSVNGQSITALEMAQMCGWIQTYLQPMVILASSLSAMFILMGSRGSDAL